MKERKFKKNSRLRRAILQLE